MDTTEIRGLLAKSGLQEVKIGQPTSEESPELHLYENIFNHSHNDSNNGEIHVYENSPAAIPLGNVDQPVAGPSRISENGNEIKYEDDKVGRVPRYAKINKGLLNSNVTPLPPLQTLYSGTLKYSSDDEKACITQWNKLSKDRIGLCASESEIVVKKKSENFVPKNFLSAIPEECNDDEAIYTKGNYDRLQYNLNEATPKRKNLEVATQYIPKVPNNKKSNNVDKEHIYESIKDLSTLTLVSTSTANKDIHPLFINADGKSSLLLANHKRVMQITKPSVFEIVDTYPPHKYCRRLSTNSQCSCPCDGNQPPSLLQSDLYEFRHNIFELTRQDSEEEILKRLWKDSNENREKRSMTKICRICGEVCLKFISWGHNAVIKIVAVHLPIIVKEGNTFPIGLCEQCDDFLVILARFVARFVYGQILKRGAKKCFTCASTTNITPMDEFEIRKLAFSLHVLRSNIDEFFHQGQRYMCASCRGSLRLFETLRHRIWNTNDVFDREDDIFYDPTSSMGSENCKFCLEWKQSALFRNLSMITKIVPKNEKNESKKNRGEKKSSVCKMNPLVYIRRMFRRRNSSNFYDVAKASKKNNEIEKNYEIPNSSNVKKDVKHERFKWESQISTPSTSSTSSVDCVNDCISLEFLSDEYDSSSLQNYFADRSDCSSVHHFLKEENSNLFEYFESDIKIPDSEDSDSYVEVPATIKKSYIRTTAEVYEEMVAPSSSSTPKVTKASVNEGSTSSSN